MIFILVAYRDFIPTIGSTTFKNHRDLYYYYRIRGREYNSFTERANARVIVSGAKIPGLNVRVFSKSYVGKSNS